MVQLELIDLLGPNGVLLAVVAPRVAVGLCAMVERILEDLGHDRRVVDAAGIDDVVEGDLGAQREAVPQVVIP